MSSPVLIRLLDPPDIPAVLEVQSASPDASQWSAADYARISDPSFHCLVVLSGGVLCGFLISRLAADELEILNLAVLPTHRRLGIASQLLTAALTKARSRAAIICFLEVRHTNSAASSFYAHHGFSQTGRRAAYYSNPPADALLLSRPF